MVILTAHSTDEGEAEALRLGASAYLAKPDEPLEIVDIVKAALRDG